MKKVFKYLKEFFKNEIILINIKIDSIYFPSKKYTLISTVDYEKEDKDFYEKIETLLSLNKESGVLSQYTIIKEVETNLEKINEIYKNNKVSNEAEELLEDLKKMNITHKLLLEYASLSMKKAS